MATQRFCIFCLEINCLFLAETLTWACGSHVCLKFECAGWVLSVLVYSECSYDWVVAC